MDILKTTIAAIEERATETKTPCKLYKSYDAAAKAGEKVAGEQALCIAQRGKEDELANSARYYVVFIPSLQKWTAIIDVTFLMNHPLCAGGYVCHAANKGFFSI